MSAGSRNNERGAVLVIVALWLPLLVIFVSFAVDAAHFWDFSRNLQNRADAAALAAASQYGGSCFGTPTQTQLDNIGQAAQQYSGPPNGTPSPSGTPNGPNLPYLFNSATPYQNQPNIAGTPSNFFLVLNGSTSYDKGGRNFDMGNFCSATYDNPADAATDVWVTQEKVPYFFPLIPGLNQPNISAHARVQLQGAGSTNSLPIAVPDPAQTPCLRAEVINDNTGGLVNDTSGNPIDVAMNPPNPNGTPPTTFWTVTLPSIKIPAAQLSVQAYIPDDCNNPGYPSNGSLFDSARPDGTLENHGVEFINTYTPLPATLSGNNAAIGAVYLTPGKDCDVASEALNQDAYFYYFPQSINCSVNVCADAEFGSGLNKPEVDISLVDANDNAGKATAMNAPGSNGDPCPATDTNAYWFNQPIASESGRNSFEFSWKANGGNSGTFNGGNPMQATYSALSDSSDPSDDSGPITQAFIGDTAGDTDVNSLQVGTTQSTLTVAFQLQGLTLSQRGDPPIVLRAAVQNRKATGAFDCGQGGAASGLATAIINGCPDPVAIYSAAQGCVHLPATPLTCADLVPGNKRNQVTNAFQTRVQSALDGGQSSPCDAWQAYSANGTSISGFEPWNPAVADPRIMVMAVTSPADLAGHGGPNNEVRILGFATFYITGFDGDPWLANGKGKGKGGNTIPNCTSPTNQDEAYPEPGTDKDQIWGHFIKYVAAGNPNGQPCNLNDVSVCVPALTR